MQEQARVVIIGSGICGSSIAYHLTQLGWTDVVMLEQGALHSGTTSHAPGLVGQLRSNPSLVRMLQYSVELYRGLEVDGRPGYFEVGSLRLASSLARMKELERQHDHANKMGLETRLVTSKEARELFPLMSAIGVEGALLVPSDGSATATVLAEALRRAAEAAGVKVYDGVKVTGIDVADGRVCAVQTSAGSIVTERVVAATGIWSPRIGAMAGVSIPLQPMQHQVVWTDSIDQLSPDKPMANMRDPDNLVYFRQDGQSLVVGGYELEPRFFDAEAIPDSANPTKIVFDAAHFEPLMAGAVKRVPAMREIRMAKLLNGIESFTPDGEFILGEAPEAAGFWAACGFCAHGVSGAGGVGKVMAEWIVEGKPSLDLSSMDIRRFRGQKMDPSVLRVRTSEIYRDYYSKIVG